MELKQSPTAYGVESTYMKEKQNTENINPNRNRSKHHDRNQLLGEVRDNNQRN